MCVWWMGLPRSVCRAVGGVVPSAAVSLSSEMFWRYTCTISSSWHCTVNAIG